MRSDTRCTIDRTTRMRRHDSPGGRANKQNHSFFSQDLEKLTG